MTRRARLSALWVGLLLALTSCSIVPTSSPTVRITQAPERPPRDVVGIEPISPARGATPEEIVRGFIDASASSVRGHPVAVEHLTPEAADSWSDAAVITLIGSDYATVGTGDGKVAVTADLVGTVDERGVFTVPTTQTYTTSFQLVEVDGEWRISDPRDGLIFILDDFQRLYDRVDAYFLDPDGRQLVPDPRYLISGEAQPTALVERLIEGPSTEALQDGTRNPLGGAQLARTVTVERQTAMVDLTGVQPGPCGELCAQLTWSLTQLGDARIRAVTISVDGEPLDPDGVERTTDDWQEFDPDAAPVDAVGHYLAAGALRTVDGRATPGPAGAGEYGLTSAAVSVDARTGELTQLFGVRTDALGLATLVAGPYDGSLQDVLPGLTLSAPTVARKRSEAWVVRDGTEIVRVPVADRPEEAVPPQPVLVPELAGLGRAQVIELSPDGVRLALVVAGSSGSRLLVGTVVRSDDGVEVRDLRPVAPSLTRVADVGWRSSGQLWVLGDAGEDRVEPYLVFVDGWGLTGPDDSGLPAQPTALGVAPGRQPLVVSNDTIWQRSGGTWVAPVRGQGPPTGSAPFYPL